MTPWHAWTSAIAALPNPRRIARYAVGFGASRSRRQPHQAIMRLLGRTPSVIALLVYTALMTPAAALAFSLSSSAFAAGQSIPSLHTCEGEDVSPPLAWTAPPPGTRSLALIVDDPDAPDPAAPRMVFAHWVLYGLPPVSGALAQGVPASALPAGTRQGTNDFRRAGYGGPCPPIGRHRYFFKLFALDVVLPDLGAATKAELERAMQGHVLATAELIGTYQKR